MEAYEFNRTFSNITVNLFFFISKLQVVKENYSNLKNVEQFILFYFFQTILIKKFKGFSLQYYNCCNCNSLKVKGILILLKQFIEPQKLCQINQPDTKQFIHRITKHDKYAELVEKTLSLNFENIIFIDNYQKKMYLQNSTPQTPCWWWSSCFESSRLILSFCHSSSTHCFLRNNHEKQRNERNERNERNNELPAEQSEQEEMHRIENQYFMKETEILVNIEGINFMNDEEKNFKNCQEELNSEFYTLKLDIINVYYEVLFEIYLNSNIRSVFSLHKHVKDTLKIIEHLLVIDAEKKEQLSETVFQSQLEL